MSETKITKDQFMELFKKKLGDLYERAEKTFGNFGVFSSWNITNVLAHASDQGREKTLEVLAILEKHFNDHLQFQHPEIRGTVCDSFAFNKTDKMFLDVCQDVLKLEPNPESV